MWLRENGLLLALLAAYVGLMALHAWQGRRRTRGMVDYFVGGRSLGGAAVGLSFFATYASTNSYLGFSGKGYSHGIAWLLLVPFAVGFSLLAWAVVAPRLRRATAELDSVTIPDYIGLRFASPGARLLAAAIVIFSSLIYMTAVYKGIGNLLEAFFDIPYWGAIALVLLIVVLYTAIGGFHSVVRTDVVQGGLMIVAALLLFAGITRAAGGVTALGEVRRSAATSHLFDWDAAMPLPVLLGILFATTVKFVVEPRQLSRFYALRDDRQVRIGIWVSTFAFLIVFSLLAPLGLYARRILGDGFEDTDRIIPELLASGDVFGGATRPFLFLAILSAALSSLDSVLLVMASTFRRDLSPWLARRLGRRLGGDDVATTRRYVLLFAAFTGLLALDPPAGIVELTAFSGALFAASFLPTMLLGLYWDRGDGRAVVASFIAGIATLALWPRLAAGSLLHPVFPAVLLSLAAYVALALAAPRGSPDSGNNLTRPHP